MMDNRYSDVMSLLKKLGTEQNRNIYRRHGAGDNLFGVSFTNLRKLHKTIKTDHELACKLWESGNTDARTLATMIADPGQMTEDRLDIWIRELSYYMLIDEYVSNIVIKTAFARSKMEGWTQSDDEWIGRAGWQLLALLAMNDKELPNGYFEKYLHTIENTIHTSKNRTRDAMNNALIAIGIRNDDLEKNAMEVAANIGKVEVDHGEMSCKTPDAMEYIKKGKARRKRK